MLLNDFFKITNKQKLDSYIIYDINLNKNHKIYEGHFPSQPIAPGVCLAQIVKELCENHLDKELKMHSSRNMKFMNILDPTKNENVSIKILIKEIDNVLYSVKANCHFEETIFFKIDAKYY